VCVWQQWTANPLRKLFVHSTRSQTSCQFAHVFASINSEDLRVNLTSVDYTDTDSSPPSSADVKNGWGYTYTPPYAFMACTRRTSPVYYTEVFVVMLSSQLIVKRNLQRTSEVNNFRISYRTPVVFVALATSPCRMPTWTQQHLIS
jgi:hypothetical protein